MPIAHVLIKVAAADHPAVVKFYEEALKPTGINKLRTFPNGMVAFGSQGLELAVAVGDSNPSPVHIAFAAPGMPARS